MTFTIRAMVAIVTLAALSACGTPDPEAEKEKYLRAKKDAVNVEFNDRAIAHSVLGFRATPVTTVLGLQERFAGSAISQPGGPEVVKADCELQAEGYAAAFEAPATVNMPSFGRDTGPVKLTCTRNGKSYSQTYKRVNLSQGGRTGTALAVGILLCPICGTAVAVGNSGDKVGDVYGFDSMELVVQ
ncbi:MAG: hypothetical protein ACE369_07315 [Roseovarius sp.]